MPILSLREAARVFAVSRATLTKDLAKGKVSGSRDDAGNWSIDAAELARVYQRRPDPKATAGRSKPAQSGHAEPAQETRVDPPLSHAAELAVRLAKAEAELAAERDKNALLERHLEDVRRMLPAPDAKPRAWRWWPF